MRRALAAALTLLACPAQAQFTPAAQVKFQEGCIAAHTRSLTPEGRTQLVQRTGGRVSVEAYGRFACSCLQQRMIADTRGHEADMTERDWLQMANFLQTGKQGKDVQYSSPQAAQTALIGGGFLFMGLQNSEIIACVNTQAGAVLLP